MKNIRLIASVVIITLMASFTGNGPDKSIKHLQKAYQDEANASRRYVLYSDRAKEDGYKEVAELFLAASKSEYIHMMNHKKALEALGAKPEQIIYEEVKINPTEKNLRESIKDEGMEGKYMYKDYIQKSQKENASAAEQSFVYAQRSEEEHAVLFRDALKNLGHNPNKDYYVSTVTGETFGVPTSKAGPEPTKEGEKFMKVSI
jgi:rubrerythrin